MKSVNLENPAQLGTFCAYQTPPKNVEEPPKKLTPEEALITDLMKTPKILNPEKRVTFADKVEIFDPKSFQEIYPPLHNDQKRPDFQQLDSLNTKSKRRPYFSWAHFKRKAIPMAVAGLSALVAAPILTQLSEAFGASSMQNTAQPLEPRLLTSQDLNSIAIRENNPTYFQGGGIVVPFFANAVGRVVSAIGKTFLLAAAQGDFPRPLAYFFPSEWWWAHAEYLTQENIEFKFKRLTFEEFFNEEVGGELDLVSEENLLKYKEAYKVYLKEFEQKTPLLKKLFHKIPKDILNNWFQENNSPNKTPQGEDIPSGFGYRKEEESIVTDKEIDLSQFDNYSQKRVMRNFAHVNRPPYESRDKTEIQISSDGRSFIQHHFPANSHLLGERNSRWNDYDLITKINSNTITTQTLTTPIDHIDGEISYSGKETLVTPNCSLIHEKGVDRRYYKTLFDKLYALDPRKQLPYFLSRAVDITEFFKNKVNIGSKGDIDAKVNISLNFPDNLPKTCEELHAT